jgi:hypothetical protein
MFRSISSKGTNQALPAATRSTAFSFAGFRLLAVLALPLCCTSCADLSAVAKFAATAESASSGFSEITADFAGSAKRRAAYVREEEKPIVLKRSETYEALEPQMLAAQKVLTEYIAALAAIATDNPDSRNASIAATQDGLVKAGMSDAQAAAGVGLATKITAALTNAYRSNKAGKVIHDCNPQLQDYLKGLEQIVGTDYPLALENERSSAEGYYEGLLHRYGEKEPLAAVTIRLQEQADFKAIDTRKKAAAAYVKILTDIGEGHQKLYDAGEHPDPKKLAILVAPYIKDIATQSVSVAKAY